ncbi:MAG: UDP-N-acetylmuramate dehydrogenase [Gammaproteobacteria bacterium]|nr:UDP-N-acetylmuramate dehydrogenase [Gammaproteobacteria bacterium]
MSAAPRTPTPALRGILRTNEPLARHTTWRVGGPAERFYEPADVDDLAAFLARTPPEEPLFWLGLGSNLLIRDGGIPGTVISTGGLLAGLDRVNEYTVRAEAGVACPKLARFCGRAGLTGAEFMAGIPGTVGGALAMNAGAFGAETWDVVATVEVIDRSGARHMRRPGSYQVGYREVHRPGEEWFIAGHFMLTAGDAGESRTRVRGLLRRRGETQPLGVPSCGSVFRNPRGDFAARLIEQAGLKGRRIGGAVVSEKHANFIVNDGGATATDIEALMVLVEREVKACCGVELRREVQVMGLLPEEVSL